MRIGVLLAFELGGLFGKEGRYAGPKVFGSAALAYVMGLECQLVVEVVVVRGVD